MHMASETPTTHLPTYDADAAPAVPRAGLGKPTADERMRGWGSLAASFALAWIVTQQLLPLAGIAWFLAVWFLFSLLIGGVVAGMRGGWPDVADTIARRTIQWAFALVLGALVSTVVFVFLRGWRPLTHSNFWFDDMDGVGPKDLLLNGGVKHAVIGSLIQLGIGLAITLPLGIGTAVFMNEVGGRFATVVRTVVEAMTALPSIVAGLFVYAVVILTLGYPRSGLAAGLAIAVMMLPIIARASDVVLRVVPGNLREASLALGASRWKTVWHVVLPTARPGLATAVILGVARGVGETSPVLLTSAAAPTTEVDPGSVMNSLPLYIFTLVRSGEPIAIQRAFGAAAVLLILVLALFVVARLVARPRSNRVRRRPVRALLRLVRNLLTLNRATMTVGRADLPESNRVTR